MKKIAVLTIFNDNSPMTEKTAPENLSKELIYTLDVRIPDNLPVQTDVLDTIVAGIDPRNDLILLDKKIKPKHFIFNRNDEILNVHYLGDDGDTFLNLHLLEKNKSYILENGDVLKIGKVEIIIRQSLGLKRPISPEKRNSSFPSPAGEEIQLNVSPIPKAEIIARKNSSTFDFLSIKLIPYKFYGLIIDFALTYLFLSYIIPSMGLLTNTQNLLSPFSEFITHLLIIQYSSIIEFFICFHFFMIVSSLILGNTPGAFLIGLHNTEKGNFLSKRFKACFCAVLNIFVLPLIIFDIPVYRGKNLKEIMTFSKRDLKSTTIFNVTRRAMAPTLILASFLSPFFLKSPFNASVALKKNHSPKSINVHTTNISSYSRELGFSLNSELNNQFLLLPYFEKNKIGIVLYDLKNKNSLLLKEEKRIEVKEALFKLRYANPLASLTIPNNELEAEILKIKTMQSLEISVASLFKSFMQYGPFLANRFLFKEQFLHQFEKAEDNYLFNPFDDKNPALVIEGTGIGIKVFIFARKEIIEFSLIGPANSMLLENFSNSILGGLRYDQSTTDRLKTPQILEVLEAFERSNYSTILTYYINEAKKVQEIKNPSWHSFLLKNLQQTKRALVEDKTRIGLKKNYVTSFDDIIKSL
jgi:hypothetical protein